MDGLAGTGPTLATGVAGTLLLLSLLGLLALAAYRATRRERVPIFDNPDRPLPNLFLGWIMLWSVSALLLLVVPTREPAMRQAVRSPFGMHQMMGSPGGGSAGDTLDGAALMTANGCGGCHALDGVSGMVGAVGPTLDGLRVTSPSRLTDPDYAGTATDPESYIRESIIAPATYIVGGYQPVMPPGYGDSLSAEQLDAIVARLLADEEADQ